MKKRILVLCTGNSCRSQMAAGFLESFDDELEVHSAGTAPAYRVHPKAISVMKEVGIDISRNKPKSVLDYLSDPFDFVITVCDNARETCPVFYGKVGRKIHIGFEDPSAVFGDDETMLAGFREVRDRMKKTFFEFYRKEIQKG